ncbi:hypothetical protein H7F15_05860 [Pontibacter sp. Tf4]|uniref:hypothetical protein n=1 Tax=Pontibacter sp. Tf4 TaxID=2761620 RepID=UPI0016259A2C|nr:hypothetical protein [Pontibacter sp. Tf4]MBB6610554.1 hypothetical protein [Pontibacter sp. Tf4]
MQFNIDKFFDRLQGQSLSRQAACLAVAEEIEDAEKQKLAFVDQASENPAFYKFICSQINSYILYLNVLYNRITTDEHKKLTKQAFDADKASVYHTMKLLIHIDQYESRIKSGR